MLKHEISLVKYVKDYFIEICYKSRKGFFMINNKLLVVRGAGDLATGIIHRLHRSGFRVLVLETQYPSAIRRQVAFCEAVYEKKKVVEGVEAVLIEDISELEQINMAEQVPVLVDPTGEAIKILKPEIVIDAIIAKRNLGTNKAMAPFTIAVGPGFCAGEDVDIVIETMRGHNLGRLIHEGPAAPDTGTPGVICGFGKERVIHAASEGVIHTVCQIGEIVEKGQTIAVLHHNEEQIPVKAELSGLIRGMIRDKFQVTKRFKIADIDPRIEEKENCSTISDKARCIAGGVLEAVCTYFFI